MSKYIIELKDDIQVVQKVGVTENGNAFVMNFYKDQLEKLNSDYISEHFGDLQDEAYHRGLEEGKKAFDLLDAERDAEYQRGLNDAWEMAKKISLMSPDEIEKVFPGAAKYNRYNLGYSGIEAIEKLKAYEEKQKADDEIKVGDEVIYNGTTKCLVVRPETDERYAVLIDGNGYHHSADHRECKKTGRHFDIEKILKEMKGDNDK